MLVCLKPHRICLSEVSGEVAALLKVCSWVGNFCFVFVLHTLKYIQQKYSPDSGIRTQSRTPTALDPFIDLRNHTRICTRRKNSITSGKRFTARPNTDQILARRKPILTLQIIEKVHQIPRESRRFAGGYEAVHRGGPVRAFVQGERYARDCCCGYSGTG
jgi:hypothetical protein